MFSKSHVLKTCLQIDFGGEDYKLLGLVVAKWSLRSLGACTWWHSYLFIPLFFPLIHEVDSIAYLAPQSTHPL